MSFIEELRRRNVVRVAVAYGLTAWLTAQIAEMFFDAFGAPDWLMQSLLILLLLGFPLAVFLAWAFELTPDGIRRDEEVDHSSAPKVAAGSRRLDRIIIVVLALAVGFLLYRQISAPEPVISGNDQAGSVAAKQAAGSQDSDPAITPPSKSVAVLPFKAMSSGENDEYFADGLTEEILNSLAGLPDLKVTARTSSFHFKGQDLPIPEIAATLGVANVVEGSVRRNGEQVRVTAQLVRSADGFHLWSDTFDGSAGDGFDLQTRIAESVATALDVVLDEERRERMRLAGVQDPQVFILLQKGIELFQQGHGAGSSDQSESQLSILTRANQYFEQVMDMMPSLPATYDYHSDYFVHAALAFAESGSMPVEVEIPLEDIIRLAREDFQASIRHSTDEDERAKYELAAMIFSDNWRGMTNLRERALTSDHCSDANWAHIISAPFGAADLLLQESSNLMRCDPINPDGYVTATAASIWLGDFRGAIEVAEKGLAVIRSEWLLSMYMAALLSVGETEKAQNVLRTRFFSAGWADTSASLMAAHLGDAQSVRNQLDADRNVGILHDAWLVISSARIGDRNTANRHAALIDARPLGPMKLAVSIYFCFCGAPFDLEATPNFAKKLEEAGLPWPPPDTIAFPLKGW